MCEEKIEQMIELLLENYRRDATNADIWTEYTNQQSFKSSMYKNINKYSSNNARKHKHDNRNHKPHNAPPNRFRITPFE